MKMRHPKSSGLSDDTAVTVQLEGMAVEFDEKATLFPVDLEEIREVLPTAARRSTRNAKSVH